MKKNKIEKIVFLEGSIGTDFKEEFDILKEMGFDVFIIDNLYEEPNKLKLIKELNPEYLFIGTTGVRKKEKEVLISIFSELKYIPKKVMFANEHSAMVYLGLSRDLKKYGTKFYFTPYSINDCIDEIEWI